MLSAFSRRAIKPSCVHRLLSTTSGSSDSDRPAESTTNSSKLLVEPAEAREANFPQQLQSAQLFAPNTDNKGQIQAGAGGLLLAAGVGLLGYNHCDVWLNLDFAAAVLLLTGAGVAGTSSLARELTQAPPTEGKKRFKFTLLNDNSRLESDIRSLDKFAAHDLTARLPPQGIILWCFCLSFYSLSNHKSYDSEVPNHKSGKNRAQTATGGRTGAARQCSCGHRS